MQKIKNIWKRIAYGISALALLFMSAVESTSKQTSARADSVINYAGTQIEDDLSDVNTLLYPKNPYGEVQVLRFQEYCYSEIEFLSDYYGLYVYLYNPTEESIGKFRTYRGPSGRPLRTFNKITMATGYNADGEASSYDNVNLIYCDSTDDNRFYKFRVEKPGNFLEMEREYAVKHNGERRYDISGFTLLQGDGTTQTAAQERAYGYTYYFTGYAEGCNASDKTAASTLACTKKPLETLKLKINQTNWRTGDFKDNVCDEINSVYFSVPNETFDEYGALQKIKAEWYEYKTTPIFVTKDPDAPAAFQPYLGKDIGELDDSLRWTVLWDELEVIGGMGTSISFRSFSGVYNKYSAEKLKHSGDPEPSYSSYLNAVSRMDWFFSREGAASQKDFAVTKEEMMEYALNYSKDSEDKIYGANGAYSSKLFEESIDADRLELVQAQNPNATSGYVCQEFDVGDVGNVLVATKRKWYEKWKGTKYVEKDYDPIVVLGQDELSTLSSMNANTFAKTYYINDADAETAFEYAKTEIKAGNRVVLFRFANTDYYASTARFENIDYNGMSSQDGYVAQETVFLDFDIISLTFRGEREVDRVIACVSNPIDIINGTDAPPGVEASKAPWWKKLWEKVKEIFGQFAGVLLLAAAIMLLSVCAPFLTPLFRGIWIVISFPFKLLGKLWEKIFKKKK